MAMSKFNMNAVRTVIAAGAVGLVTLMGGDGAVEQAQGLNLKRRLALRADEGEEDNEGRRLKRQRRDRDAASQLNEALGLDDPTNEAVNGHDAHQDDGSGPSVGAGTSSGTPAESAPSTPKEAERLATRESYATQALCLGPRQGQRTIVDPEVQQQRSLSEMEQGQVGGRSVTRLRRHMSLQNRAGSTELSLSDGGLDPVASSEYVAPAGGAGVAAGTSAAGTSTDMSLDEIEGDDDDE